MADKRSLLQCFEAFDKDGIMEILFQMLNNDLPLPLEDMFIILDETADVEIISVLLEVLLFRLDDVSDSLMKVYQLDLSEVVRRHLILVFSASEKSKYMQFLMNDYFENPYNRPAIRQIAFKHKKLVFMNLVRFVEALELTAAVVDTCKQILQMVPREGRCIRRSLLNQGIGYLLCHSSRRTGENGWLNMQGFFKNERYFN